MLLRLMANQAKTEQASERDNMQQHPGGAGGSGPSGPEKLIIELTISGRCRRRPCADATEGEDAEPGPFRRRLTQSFPSALLAVAEEELDVEDIEALSAAGGSLDSSTCK